MKLTYLLSYVYEAVGLASPRLDYGGFGAEPAYLLISTYLSNYLVNSYDG